VATGVRLLTDSGVCSDYLFKMVLIGDTHVGKSCLLIRFAVSRSWLSFECVTGLLSVG